MLFANYNVRTLLSRLGFHPVISPLNFGEVIRCEFLRFVALIEDPGELLRQLQAKAGGLKRMSTETKTLRSYESKGVQTVCSSLFPIYLHSPPAFSQQSILNDSDVDEEATFEAEWETWLGQVRDEGEVDLWVRTERDYEEEVASCVEREKAETRWREFIQEATARNEAQLLREPLYIESTLSGSQRVQCSSWAEYCGAEEGCARFKAHEEEEETNEELYCGKSMESCLLANEPTPDMWGERPYCDIHCAYLSDDETECAQCEAEDH